MVLEIITPRKKVKDVAIVSITVPTPQGEITVLERHIPLMSLVAEGIISYRESVGKVDTLAIGEGYLQTDGKVIRILVSRAYGQDEIDEKLTEEAIERAKKMLTESPDKSQKIAAESLLRRSIIDSKLIKRHKHTQV